MGIAIKRYTSVGVEVETTEGTYVAPTAATHYVQTLDNGLEVLPAKQLLARNIFNSSIGHISPLVGESQVKATIPCEARAGATEGAAPQYDGLIKSAFGTSRQIATNITTKAGNTASVLQIQDADIGSLNIGDMILVKKAGAYHVSPISAKDSTVGAANVTLLAPHPSGSIPDNCVLGKATTYVLAETGHPSLSISKYLDNAVLEQATGCKVSSLALENFATGQIPSLKFGLEGLNFGRSVTANPFTPSYDSTLPPIVLDGRVYLNNSTLEMNKLTFTLQNKLGFETSINAANGRVSSRVTDRTISGEFDPYKLDNDISNFTLFTNNTAFSLFAYAKVPTGTAGEFGNVIAVYMPNCIITEMGEADQEGLLQDAIKFSANRGSSGTTPEIYISFI